MSTDTSLLPATNGKDIDSPKGDQRFLIAGIGASAGGIQALRGFFAKVPADSGIAYVVIPHLSPDHKSELADVLQHVAAIPVMQVTCRMRIEPDHVYVLPPAHHLIMEDGHIAVPDNTASADHCTPVDLFFRSLAESHHGVAVCVVLSGTGADGSMGLKHIKELRTRPWRLPDAAGEANDHKGRITYADLHQQLLEHYAPPSVVVNEEYEILHLSDKARQYLQVSGGEPSSNLPATSTQLRCIVPA